MTKLEIENQALRALTLKLGRMVLTSAGNTPCGADNFQVVSFDTMSPDQIVAALRDLSLECERLVRMSDKHTAAEDFQAIGIEFADLAAQIEVASRIPGGASAGCAR